MVIEDLHVKNFRGFKERDFSFHPKFNVLVGDNATGKTALLRALRIAAASWFLGIKGRDSVGIRSSDVRLEGKAYEAGEYAFEEQYPVEISASGLFEESYWEDKDNHLEWKRRLNGPNGRTTRRGARKIKSLAEEADGMVRDKEDVTLPVISYYSTSRLYLEPRRTQQRRKTPDKKELSRLEGYQDCVDKRLDTKALTQWIKRQSWMAWQEGKSSKLFNVVQSAITDVVEGATSINFEPEREEVVITLGNEDAYPLDHLSDGQRTTLTLVGDLAIRAARLNPHLGERALSATPGVVLIDELDMHLHPMWQRHIVQDIKDVFESMQFFATTHSPFIIQTLDKGELLLLDEKESINNFKNVGIEKIARVLMGVDRPDVAPEYEHMVALAKDYLLTIEEVTDDPEKRFDEYKELLSKKIEPYADNPAYQAFLELQKEGKLSE